MFDCLRQDYYYCLPVLFLTVSLQWLFMALNLNAKNNYSFFVLDRKVNRTCDGLYCRRENKVEGSEEEGGSAGKYHVDAASISF